MGSGGGSCFLTPKAFGKVKQSMHVSCAGGHPSKGKETLSSGAFPLSRHAVSLKSFIHCQWTFYGSGSGVCLIENERQVNSEMSFSCGPASRTVRKAVVDMLRCFTLLLPLAPSRVARQRHLCVCAHTNHSSDTH